MNLVPSGALLIDKPEGMTSFGVVGKIRYTLSHALEVERKKSIKVGHGGTLDPFATGLLVVLIGRGSRLAEYYLHGDKAYEARAQFGIRTESGDLTNEVVEETKTLPTSVETLQTAANAFLNRDYLQTPPMHSAIKVGGQRLYKMAREGKSIDRPPRLCRIGSFNVLDWESPHCRFSVEVSSGTYIRTLAEDWAGSAESLAVLDQLRRTRSGAFHVDDAISLDSALKYIEKNKQIHDCPSFVPFDKLLTGPTFGKIELSSSESKALVVGQQKELYERLHSENFDPTIFVSGLYYQGRLSGVIRRNHDNPWQIERVFIDRIEAEA